MQREIISENLKTIMVKIGKSIEKGIGEDIRTYLATSDNATNNAISFLRGDYINTNIKKSMEDESVEIKYFKRSSWTGCIIIDREDKVSISVCSKKTLDRIPKNMNRKSPHYLQSILNTVNKNEIASVKQMSIADFDSTYAYAFSEEDYEKDFEAIMEEALSLRDDYRHWIISYEAERTSLVELSAVLMDGAFNTVQEISLMEMLKPDFGDLTVAETKSEKQKDVRSLVSIKPGIVGYKASEPKMQTEMSPKSIEESKKA